MEDVLFVLDKWAFAVVFVVAWVLIAVLAARPRHG